MPLDEVPDRCRFEKTRVSFLALKNSGVKYGVKSTEFSYETSEFLSEVLISYSTPSVSSPFVLLRRIDNVGCLEFHHLDDKGVIVSGIVAHSGLLIHSGRQCSSLSRRRFIFTASSHQYSHVPKQDQEKTLVGRSKAKNCSGYKVSASNCVETLQRQARCVAQTCFEVGKDESFGDCGLL